MKRIGLVVNPRRVDAILTVRELIDGLLKNGICELYVEKEVAKAIGRQDLGCPEDELAYKIDLLIAMGGDGTLLYGARIISEREIPLLGVNLGSLGFLAGISEEELDGIISDILEDRFGYELRMMLKTEVLREGSPAVSFAALNDAAINMGSIARVLTLEILIEGEYLGTYAADGVIVATPTGSTAYSLSAGGPIVNPAMEALILTPICPHTLAIRPMVLPATQSIEVIIKEANLGAVLTIDGQRNCPLNQGDRLIFTKAERPIRLIKSNKGFYELVRTKLGWGGLKERDD